MITCGVARPGDEEPSATQRAGTENLDALLSARDVRDDERALGRDIEAARSE
jgi:hypothetical protein